MARNVMPGAAQQRFATLCAEALRDELARAGLEIKPVVHVDNTGRRSVYKCAVRDVPTAVAAARTIVGDILPAAGKSIEFADLPLPQGATVALTGEAGRVRVRVCKVYDVASDEDVIRVDAAYNAV